MEHILFRQIINPHDSRVLEFVKPRFPRSKLDYPRPRLCQHIAVKKWQHECPPSPKVLWRESTVSNGISLHADWAPKINVLTWFFLKHDLLEIFYTTSKKLLRFNSCKSCKNGLTKKFHRNRIFFFFLSYPRFIRVMMTLGYCSTCYLFYADAATHLLHQPINCISFLFLLHISFLDKS